MVGPTVTVASAGAAVAGAVAADRRRAQSITATSSGTAPTGSQVSRDAVSFRM